MSKSQKQLSVCLAVLATSVSAMGADSWIYYDGTGSPKLDGLGNQLYVTSTTEIGDQITLGGLPSGEYPLTKFQFEYYATGMTSASKGQVHLYAGSPSGTPVWSSAEFSLKNSYNSVTIGDGSAQFAMINKDCTWTVSFGGLTGSPTFGLLLNGDPSTGVNYTDYWAKDGSGNWKSYLIDAGATSANFSARVTAIPEPTTITLGLLALGALGYAGLRRR